MSARMPGPLGLHEVPQAIDAGTLCRSLSWPPGPLLGLVDVPADDLPVLRRSRARAVALPPPIGPGSGLLRRMRPQDVEAFLAAAAEFQVYIVVRRTNSASIPYIGKAGYVPKRIDCKAKTADRNFFHQGLGRPLVIAGLVVKPDLPEFEKAFRADKYASALKCWNEFRPLVIEIAGASPGFRPYVVETDESSPRYGCVKLVEGAAAGSGKYVHGDYDLYAILEQRHQTTADFFEGQLFFSALDREEDRLRRQSHFFGPNFEKVRVFVNGRIGSPMIQHGSQALLRHTNEWLDVFCPDGTVKALGAVLTDLTD